MQSETSNKDILVGLERIRRLRRLQWGLWLGFIPFALIAVALQPPDWLLLPIGVLWFISFVVISIVHGASRCPACRNSFNYRWGFGNAFTSKCMNCGLRLKVTSLDGPVENINGKLTLRIPLAAGGRD